MPKIEIDLVDLTVLQAENTNMKNENERLKHELDVLSIRREEFNADNLAWEGFWKYQKAMLELLGFDGVHEGRYMGGDNFYADISFRDVVRNDAFNPDDFGVDLSIAYKKGYKSVVLDVIRIDRNE